MICLVHLVVRGKSATKRGGPGRVFQMYASLVHCFMKHHANPLLLGTGGSRIAKEGGACFFAFMVQYQSLLLTQPSVNMALGEFQIGGNSLQLHEEAAGARVEWVRGQKPSYLYAKSRTGGKKKCIPDRAPSKPSFHSHECNINCLL